MFAMVASTAKKKFDSRWFKTELEKRGLTQRDAAKELRLDPSAISLTFTGKRRLKLDEAVTFARLLNRPLDDVLAAAGIRAKGTEGAAGVMKIAGSVDAGFWVHFGKVRGSAPAPALMGDGVAVVRHETTGTVMESWDGALIYYRDGQVGVDSGAINRYCLVKYAGRDAWRIAVVKKGYEPGTYHLSTMTGQLLDTDVELETATPVIWVKT